MRRIEPPEARRVDYSTLAVSAGEVLRAPVFFKVHRLNSS